MKGKQIFLAIAITVALLVVVFLMLKREEIASRSNETSIGKKLFDNMPVNDVQEIKIKGYKAGEVHLVKGDDLWLVSSLYNYPADFTKIKEFISEISELKNIQNIEVGQSNLSRLNLELNNTEESGTSIDMLGKDNKPIASIIVGKEHKKKSQSPEEYNMEFPDGRYILLPDKKDVHVVDKLMTKIENPSKDWLNRDFISEKDLKTMSLEQNGEIKWTISRNKKEDSPVPQNPIPEEHEIDKDKISSISNSLYTIRFATIADPALDPKITGLDSPSIFRAETFNGKKYELLIGKQHDNTRYVKVSVSYSAPKDEAPHSDEKTPSDDPKAKEEKEKKAAERAEELKKAEEEAKSEQKKYGNWIYLIAESSLKPMLSTENELFKKLEKKEDTKKEETTTPEPTTPTVDIKDDQQE